mgnify:CR=1 FL=1
MHRRVFYQVPIGAATASSTLSRSLGLTPTEKPRLRPTAGFRRIAARFRQAPSCGVCAGQAGDAADHVAGFAHGDLRIGHRRLLRADCRGQRLQIHMSADRHHADHAFGAGVRHQRLEHLMLVETELGGGLNPITVIHVIVRMRVFVGLNGTPAFSNCTVAGVEPAPFSCFFFAMPPIISLPRVRCGVSDTKRGFRRSESPFV